MDKMIENTYESGARISREILVIMVLHNTNLTLYMQM